MLSSGSLDGRRRVFFMVFAGSAGKIYGSDYIFAGVIADFGVELPKKAGTKVPVIFIPVCHFVPVILSIRQVCFFDFSS